MTAPKPWTVGPWTITPGQKPPHYLFVYGARGQSVAMIFDRYGDKADAERNANADLIRTAPELWDAVDELLEIISEFEVDGLKLNSDQMAKLRRAEAVFEKALGNA